MKSGAIILTALLLAGGPARAGFFTGEQLLVKCASEEVVHQLACVFYLAGAVDASQTHHKWGDISRQFCMDPGVDIVNLREVYLRYAVEHVGDLQLPATGTALNSFIAAFPCE
jgi:hypothetical protein